MRSKILYYFLDTVGTPLESMNFFVHAFNSMTSMGDLFIGAMPCNLMHFYQPGLVMLAYTIFSAVYWAVGGVTEEGLHYIYPILNWDNPSFTAPLIVDGLVILVPFVHFLVWALHQLRDYVLDKLATPKPVGDIKDHPE